MRKRRRLPIVVIAVTALVLLVFNPFLAHKDVVYGYSGTISVKDFGAKGDGITNDTAAIQAALNKAGYIIVFPAGTYIASNLKINSNSKLVFNNAVFKYPSNVINYAAMFYIGCCNRTAAIENVIIEGGLTIDAAGFAAGRQLRGIQVAGAKNWSIKGVTGKNLPDQYPVFVTKSYYTPAIRSTDGVIEDITAYDCDWGAVGIVDGERISVNRVSINAPRKVIGVAVAVETDVPNAVASTLSINNIKAADGCEGVNLIAHGGIIQGISVDQLQVTTPKSTTHGVNISADIGSKPGTLKNITLKNMSISDGGAIVHSANNVKVENLTIQNVHVTRSSEMGFRVNAASFYQCSAKESMGNGFATANPAIPNSITMSFVECVAENNNRGNTVNTSGFRLDNIYKATLTKCIARDTRVTKLQSYGLFGSSSIGTYYLSGCDFSNNKIGSVKIVSGGRLIYQ